MGLLYPFAHWWGPQPGAIPIFQTVSRSMEFSEIRPSHARRCRREPDVFCWSRGGCIMSIKLPVETWERSDAHAG
jgi:hypothetical protein